MKTDCLSETSVMKLLFEDSVINGSVREQRRDKYYAVQKALEDYGKNKK
jgi:hypothetical protein